MINDNESEIRVNENSILSALVKRREELLKELTKYDSELTKLQEYHSERLRKLKEGQKPLQDGLRHVEALLKLEGWVGATKDSVAKSEKVVTNSQVSYIDIAYQVLVNFGKPMHYTEIFTKLREKGIYVPGKNAPATFLAKIGRDNRFKRVKKRGTYALANWRIASAKSRSRKSKKKREGKN
jgi:hypothetical protein